MTQIVDYFIKIIREISVDECERGSDILPQCTQTTTTITIIIIIITNIISLAIRAPKLAANEADKIQYNKKLKPCTTK